MAEEKKENLENNQEDNSKTTRKRANKKNRTGPVVLRPNENTELESRAKDITISEKELQLSTNQWKAKEFEANILRLKADLLDKEALLLRKDQIALEGKIKKAKEAYNVYRKKISKKYDLPPIWGVDIDTGQVIIDFNRANMR